MERIITSGNDEAIWSLVNDGNPPNSWLLVFHPESYHDEGVVFTKMISSLLDVAKRQYEVKLLLTILKKSYLQSLFVLAQRESKVMIEVLLLALEHKVFDEQEEARVISVVQTTAFGREQYEVSRDQRTAIGGDGPETLSLPVQSTDDCLESFLNGMPCGNLRTLDLTSTFITWRSAKVICKLPALENLILRSCSIFGDRGLKALCDGLNLKTLDLTETSLTDEGMIRLKNMSNLTHLNLNSTHLSAAVYDELKLNLPNLIHCDITYTPADFTSYSVS